MFKKIFVLTVFVALAGLLIFGVVNRTQARGGSGNDGNPGLGAGRQEAGIGYYGGNQSQASQANGELANLPAANPDGLSPEETEALLFMREEEKLAQDVYLTLDDQWGLAIFEKIAASEQTHTSAVQVLLDRYGLADPASSQTGVFNNPDLQDLYDRLVAQGSQSLLEAIKVGGTIEEIDILDLQSRLAQADNLDIIQVFNNLLNGSENHLRAFASVYHNQTGETYQPQYLDAADYQSITATGAAGSSNAQAGGGRGNGGRGGAGGGRP